MGLDISAYKQVERVPEEKYVGVYEEGSDEYWDLLYGSGWIIPWVREFPDHAHDIVHKAPYTYEDYISFQAGSYSSYNYWRDLLAKFAGYESAEEVWALDHPWNKPFVELINFSDCEGTIGTVLCRKLYRDFEENIGRIKEFIHDEGIDDPHDYFERTYREFREGFAFAADSGFMQFH